MLSQPDPELIPLTNNTLNRTYTGTTLSSIRLIGPNRDEKIKEFGRNST